MDFTIKKYKLLLNAFQKAGYSFITFEGFIKNKPSDKTVILRHDVDKLPVNSLETAQLENRIGIKGSYYFRIVPESNHPEIIKGIVSLGHEIGYHYEDMTLCKGEYTTAIKSFEKNLLYFRQFYPVKTICMHGSPMSRYDSRDLWNKFDYHILGLTGEPYFDIDFSKVLYLSDTGRRWNGANVSVRDKPMNNIRISVNDYRYTNDVISAIQRDVLPNLIMLTVHPQRWSDNLYRWCKEFAFQNIKNTIKFFIVKVKI